MEIIKIKPYFIEKVNSLNEFKEIQIALFKKGYCWVNTTEVWETYLINFPIYISNLEFKNCNKKESIRTTYNQYSNNILWFGKYDDFDTTELRKEKLKKLKIYD